MTDVGVYSAGERCTSRKQNQEHIAQRNVVIYSKRKEQRHEEDVEEGEKELQVRTL